jgi:Flp pilus assembly pilin Flp
MREARITCFAASPHSIKYWRGPLTKLFNNLLQDETGAELAEYAVAVALLVAIALAVYNVLGQAIVDQNNGTAAKVQEAANKTFPF